MEYVCRQLEQTRSSGRHEKHSLGPKLGEKAWREKAAGGGGAKVFVSWG